MARNYEKFIVSGGKVELFEECLKLLKDVRGWMDKFNEEEGNWDLEIEIDDFLDKVEE